MNTWGTENAMGSMTAVHGLTTAAAGDNLEVRRGLVTSVEPCESTIKDARIMIVDDEPINIRVVCKYLQSAGYANFITTSESVQAMKTIAIEQPDVLLLDLMMPEVSGLDILEALQGDACLKQIPVLILTASNDTQTKLRALQLGVTDFLRKPVDASELVVRIRNMLIVKSHRDHLTNYSVRLEHEVRLRTAELDESRRDLIHVLACAAEYRDQETGNHVIRVGRYAGIIADQFGLERERINLIELAAVLHDVGKIGVSDTILLKPGKLDPQEVELMKNHCEFGMNILRGVPCNGTTQLRQHLRSQHAMQSPILQMAATIAISHHEKWDGSGYPLGLAGPSIPLEGRITAVADVFDALSSARPYKPPLSWDKCCTIMEEGRNTHFDPQVLDAFFAREGDIREVQTRYQDIESSFFQEQEAFG